MKNILKMTENLDFEHVKICVKTTPVLPHCSHFCHLSAGAISATKFSHSLCCRGMLDLFAIVCLLVLCAHWQVTLLPLPKILYIPSLSCVRSFQLISQNASKVEAIFCNETTARAFLGLPASMDIAQIQAQLCNKKFYDLIKRWQTKLDVKKLEKRVSLC
jgi:hypothetical protein